MPKDECAGEGGGKSQLFELNYIYGVFQLQNSKKKTFTRSKNNDFYLSFSNEQKIYNMSSILIL